MNDSTSDPSLDPQNERDAMQRAVLSGDRSIDDPAVRALPVAARRELTELLALRDWLEVDHLARTHELRSTEEQRSRARRFLANAPGSLPVAGEGPLASVPRPLTLGRRAAPWLLVAGLALLAAEFLGWFETRESPAPAGGSGRLGGPRPAVVLEEPIGRHRSDSEFRWSGVLRPDESFRVHYTGSDPLGPELDASEPLREKHWTSDLPLPEHLHWRVDVVDGDGIVARGEWVESRAEEGGPPERP